MHVKNNDMYPMARQKLPNGEMMTTFPSPAPSPMGAATSVPLSPQKTSGFSMVMGQNNRMAGSVPVWNASPINNLGDIQKSKDDDFGFLDFLDMINPLQHIPFVGQAYRAITGDVIKPIAEVIGGGIFGGPVGAATGAASAAIGGQMGDDLKQAFSGIFLSGNDDNDTTIAITNLRATPHYNE